MVLRTLMTGPPDLAHLMAAEWPALTDRERERALERAAQEGWLAARWTFAEREDGRPGPLRACRWARKNRTHRVSAAAAHESAVAHTLPVEHDYVDHVIDRCAPDRMSWWGGSDPDELREDPRVCAFCAAYERERRAILRKEPLPTGIADLRVHLWNTKEQERETAREWYKRAHQSYCTPGYAASQRNFIIRGYRWHQFHTDLTQMLLTAAIFRGPVDLPADTNTNTPRGHPEDTKRQFAGMDRMGRIGERGK